MIKFEYAIHKKTKKIIDYETFKQLSQDARRELIIRELNEVEDFISEQFSIHTYTYIDILMGGDFDFIYENIFSEKELLRIRHLLYSSFGNPIDDAIRNKLNKEISEISYIGCLYNKQK